MRSYVSRMTASRSRTAAVALLACTATTSRARGRGNAPAAETASSPAAQATRRRRAAQTMVELRSALEKGEACWLMCAAKINTEQSYQGARSIPLEKSQARRRATA